MLGHGAIDERAISEEEQNPAPPLPSLSWMNAATDAANAQIAAVRRVEMVSY
jgi:hypothetical protein